MIPYTIFDLDNGLRVVHSHDPYSALVVVHVLYDTGSRDEDIDHTGMAHLFEHLMFGGSANIPNFDQVLQMAGGTNNAATSNDFTIFYEALPKQNAETAFYLESDRMMALAFSDKALEVQRKVVIEEFKQVCLNQPYGKAMHYLREMLYHDHPYRWPVIGIKPEHIEQVTQDDVRKWHAEHYAPNNAILAVVGNISLDRTRELAEKWFGSLPARSLRPRNLPNDPWPEPNANLHEVITDNVPQTAIYIAYRMDAHGEAGYREADAITDILAAGQSSRLYQRLVLGSDLFTHAEAMISGSEDSGMLIINGYVTREDPESIAQAKALLLQEARQLAEPGNVSEYELNRTKNRYESVTTFENINLKSRAQNLAAAVYHHENINEEIPAYRRITLEDIQHTAQRLFIDHSPAILLIRPKSL